MDHSEHLSTSQRIDDQKSVEELCSRIDSKEPVLQILIPEADRNQRIINELESQGEEYKLLKGVILGVKDIFITEGFATRAGSNLPADLFDGKEASCVTKLKTAGAIILGKTVTTEFAYFEPGPTRNPVNPDYTPGGSSSGSAAAVAAGYCHVALGSQTIGSVIRPAAFCGVIGFKPSFDRIPTDGVIPFSPSADHVGYFGCDLEIIELVSRLLCKNWKKKAGVSGLPVIGVPSDLFIGQADELVRNHFKEMISLLKQKGAEIIYTDALENIEAINTMHKRMVAADFAQVHKNWYRDYKHLYRPHSALLVEEGAGVSEEELNAARNGKLEQRMHLDRLMKSLGIDVWLSPSTLTPPLKGIESTGSPLMNLPWTYTGLPTINLPLGKTPDNLPLGIQVTGRFNEDEALLYFSSEINKQIS